MLLDKAVGVTFYNTKFQWAPTLGGECYLVRVYRAIRNLGEFQWAPTLGGECYLVRVYRAIRNLGEFQWAPTLGGECYSIVYLITPPLCQGVNALLNISPRF